MLPIVLASSSKYRRQQLEKLDIPFIVHAPEIDESPRLQETPEDLVKRLSTEKARALAAQYPHHLIIGSDQVATFNNHIITKPGNHFVACNQLHQFSGKSVTFLTGLTLLNSAENRIKTDIVETAVNFRPLNDIQIDRYLVREQPYDCAGSFKVEGLGITLFESINSQDPTALIGIPLISLCSMLLAEGVVL